MMESEEIAKLHVTVVPEFVASEEFDRMAELFGYVKELDGLDCMQEVIRCKDCKYFSDNRVGHLKGVCEFWATDHVVKPSDFCSMGKVV